MLQNGVNIYSNKCQKIGHYCARSTKKGKKGKGNRRLLNHDFYFVVVSMSLSYKNTGQQLRQPHGDLIL